MSELIFRAPLNDREMKSKMLIATDVSRKAALDMRLVSQELFSDNPGNKASHCARLVAEYYNKYNEQKGTQFIFSDLSTYKPGEWNVFQEIKDKLVNDYNIPESEIRFIQEAKNQNQRKAIIEAMNRGEVRVLFGSTTTLGTGVNAQKRAVAVHHIDIPWRPSDLEQRDGRARRSGNEVAKLYADNNVDIIIYAVERTLDSYKFNLLQNKQIFINQLKTNSLGTRVVDEGAMDEENGMNFAEYVAILSGNDDLLQKAKLEKKVLALESERKTYMQARRDTEYRLEKAKSNLSDNEKYIKYLKEDNEAYLSQRKVSDDGTLFPGLKIKNVPEYIAEGVYNVEGLGTVLQNAGRTIGYENHEVGTVYGFPLKVESVYEYESYTGKQNYVGNKFWVEGHIRYEYNYGKLALSKDNRQAAVNYGVNALEKIPSLIKQHEDYSKKLRSDIAEYERIAGKSWNKEEELKTLHRELDDLEKKIQASLEVTNASLPKPEELPYKISKEGNSHKVTYLRKSYPLVSVTEMKEFARPGDWRNNGYVSCTTYRDKVMVSTEEVVANFSSRYAAEKFVEKLTSVSEQRENDTSWIVEHARQDVADDINIATETIHSARHILEERGIDWHQPVIEEAEAVEVQDDNKVEENNDQKTFQVYSVGKYGEGEKGEELRRIAHQVKEFGSDSSVQMAVTQLMGIFNQIPAEEKKRMVLIAMPGTTGYADYMKKVVDKLSESTYIKSFNILNGTSHDSLYDLKKNGVKYEDLPEIRFSIDNPLSKGTIAVLVDNVLDTGRTLSQAIETDFGEGVEVRAAVLAHTDNYKEHNANFIVKTVDDLKKVSEVRKEDKEESFAAAVEKFRSEHSEDLSAHEKLNVARLLNISWNSLFGKEKAQKELAEMGIDWRTGGALESPSVKMHSNSREVLTNEERSLLSQIAMDLETGNHLLGYPRPAGYQDMMKEVHDAFEAVGNWELTAYQASLLKEMSKNYHDGYSDLASVIGVDESILRHSLAYFETHPRGMGYKPYFIYDEEDGRYAVDYPNGFGFSEDYANILANAHHGEPFRREGRLQFYFDDMQSAVDFVETVDKEAVRIDRKISVALDKKLEEAGIKVHLNTLEAQQVLGAKYMFVPTGNIFISNARRAVESIQQSKATPEQWLRMIDKRGGIKSGEDRWTGLSEWLRDSKERTLTKYDILEYISEHQIQINESHYSESFDILDFVKNVIDPKFEKYKEEVIADERDAMISKRGESYVNLYFDSYIYNRREKIAQVAFDRMVGEYGEDFSRTFYLSVPQGDRYQLSIKNEQYIAGLINEGERPINPIRLRYTTPGLINKKELALSVPTILPYREKDYIHFGDADGGRAIAWVRFGDSVINVPATGKEEHVLVIDEIQSYRHQEGRVHGYATLVETIRIQNLEELKSDAIWERDNYLHFLMQKYRGQLKGSDIEDLFNYEKMPSMLLFTDSERDKYYELICRINERVELLNVYKTEYHIDNYSVPVAPFEKNWHELVMKRMLRYAVENGYDRIAWTKGVQQSERYNIGYTLDNIYIEDIYTSPDDNEIHRYLHVGFKDQLNTFFTVDVNKDGIATLDKDDFNENLYNKFNGEHISKIFGNHLAEQIMNFSKGEKISGIGIHIDGEGMSAFYDNIIPGFMDKYCKKWGVTVHDTEVVDDIMHGVDITDGMRDDLRQSQPMFFRANDREIYGFVHDGEIYIDDNIATAETRLHERAHLFAAVMREKNPEEWQNIVNMMKDTPEVWNYVRREYPHLHTDDEIADEALAQFSGRHGLKKLQDFANGYDDAETIFGKVSAALSKFWKFVCDFFEMHYTSKEEVADRILYDTLNGVKLPELQIEVSDQYHFVGKNGAANIDAAIGGLNIRMMERAELLEQGGSSPLDIKIETGWERGADGQWMMEIPGFRSFDPYGNTEWLKRHSDVRRYLQLLQKQSSYQYGIGEALSVEEQLEFDRLKELDDVKNYHSRITQKNSDMLSVGDYIDAPLLFAAYPGLSSMAVRVEDMEDRGSFNTRQSIIDGSDVHYIQLNKEMVEKACGFELTSYNEMQSILAHEIQHYIQFQEGFPCGIGLSLLQGDLADKMVQYRKNAGEVQSRVVQNRIGMTIQERRQTLSEDYEDVPRGQQIFTYDSVIAAFRDADNYLDEQYISDVRYERDVMSETDVDNDLLVSLTDRLSSMGIEVVTDIDAIKAELDVTTKPFKDGEGKVYGFTKNGKIYIDSAIATAETPIHEYAHLWVTVLRETSPHEWENVKNLMKGTLVWDEISRRYNDLSDEDAIADEVIATYSGRRGAELLRKEVSKSIVNGTIDKSNAYAIFDNVRSALGYFWSKISEIFGLSYVTPDDVADMVLKDFLDGRNPVAYTNSRIDEILNDDKLRFHFIGETGAARIDESNKDSHLLDSLSKAKEMTVTFEERRLTPADREVGGAIVDHLEKMGINVHTDLKEYRHAMKAAENDNSQEGNVRYFTTESRKRYGFSYKGEMYLDLRKVDAELPLNQYARLWCQTMQKVNPEGWANIVATLKNDHDSWDFAHRRFGDISSDDTLLAEEIICSYSGRRGAGKLQEELKRMSSKDESYSSRWGNIFNNISKVIQDFWKHTGDSLNIDYKNVDDIADMILKDFASQVNPVKKMENWLKDRDKEYAEAVASGDMGKAYSLFNAALQEHVGNGITPYVAVDGYRGRMDRLARNVKSDNPVVREEAINEAADRMTPLLRTYNADNAVLVPAPSHIGYATDMLSLANAISERTGIQVVDVLKSDARESQYNAKKETGKALSSEQLGIRKEGELPEGKLPIVIDNVVNSGNTAKACVDALGGGIVLAVASAVSQSRHVSTLKSAEPVLYDKNNNLVPLSERFEFKNKHMSSVQGMPSEKPIPYQEPDIIQGLESYDIEDIRAYVENSVQEVLDIEYPDKDIYIKQVTIIGSRARGEGHEDSDLDILLEYGGNDVREDDLFDVLNNEENKVSLEGIEFDINPINVKRSLSTAEWLARDEKWREKDLSMNNNNKQNNIMDKNEQKEQLQAKQKDLLKSFTGIKSAYENEVVLLRQKGFMETFGKDAVLASEQFDVPLYERTIGDEKLPFALVSYEKYVENIGEVDVDLHIVSNPVELEIMEEITPFIAEISTEENEKIDSGRLETLAETMKGMVESAAEDELQDDPSIGSDRDKELEESKDKVLGLIDDLVSITNDDNGLLAQLGRTYDLVNELGLLYVPITLRVPVVVNHSKEEIVEDWRLEDDKAIITDVTFTNEDCKIYKSFLNAYDDENGFSITDLSLDKWKEVLDLVEEQLNDQDRQITVYVDTRQVPDWALPVLVNGEADGLSDEEEDMVNKFMEQYKGCIYSPRDESPSFNNSPAFGLATDTIPVDIVRITTPRQLREEQQENITGQVSEDASVEKPVEVKEEKSDVLPSAEDKQANSEMAKELEPLSAEEQKATEVVEQPKEEEKKPKSKWDNLDYTKYTLPEGVVVENAKVTRIPPKEGEKYAKFVISADAFGKHYSKEMWGNDIKAYYEKDEYGKRTNRVALDQLVAKYFGKQFADSMSIGSVQEAEHVLSEQKEEKHNAAESAEQKQQVQSDKDMEEQKAVEQKKAEEEAARKEEEEKKNDKKEKVPAVLIQSTLIMNALLSAKEHDGQWLNRDGKTSPDFVQGGQSVSPFNALMMALHSDANGYKTNIYTTFNAARSNKCSVRSGQSGLPFNWYNWDKYVNRFNSNEVISKDAYENLPEQEKELFKVLRSKEERSVFNIDQTTMPNVQSAEYDAILEKQNNEQSKLKDSPEKEDSEKYTSVYKQYSSLKEKHSDAVLLFRCGDFYETYMGDAEKVSKLLNLNVIESQDKKDFDGNWLKTVGFPYHALDTYLPKLIRGGCRVAICEKLDDPRQNKRFGVADTIYSKSNELIDSLKKYDNVIVDTLSESFYNSEKDMLHFNNSRKSLLGAEVTTAIERFNDVCRASVGYTGGESRLNRIGSSKMLPEDAVKYDRLVQELASGVMMVREGYPATLSDESIEMIPYWERELKESPLLIENIEKDVNNAVEVLEKMKNNEAIDYGSIRGEKSFDAMRPKLYTIATELAKLPNVDTKTVVIVKDDKTKSAAVILPAGASLEVNNEIPGMNKNRFVIGLKRQGYENIQFFNSGGSLGLKQSNEFFADKIVEISRLKQYDIVNLETLDLSAEIDRTSRVDIENVSMTRDDKGNYLLYVKPVESESFTVYPERNDIKKFFDSIRTKDFDNVRETLGQKYYGLVLRHPDLKCNELMPDIIDGIDLSRITKVNITKDKYKPNTTIIFATIDGEKQKPVELNSVQAQRFWLVNDQDMYKLSLAAQIWQDKLSVVNGQSEDGQAQFHNYSEGQGADIGSSSVEEKDDVQVQAQDNKKGGGLRV